MNKDICQSIETDEIQVKDDKSLIAWIEKQADKYQLKYFLGHADDGVIWGKFDDNNNYQLTTAEQIFKEPAFKAEFPKLRLMTLQQCRIFGENGEILLWNIGNRWKARLIEDKSDIEHIQKSQYLWGTQGEEKDGFTLLSDGSQGLKHAVPLKDINSHFSKDKQNLYRPVRLVVNHYIKYDEETGIARIFISRLVSLYSQPQKVTI